MQNHCSMTQRVMQEGARGLFAAAPRVAFPNRFGKTEVTYSTIIAEKSPLRKSGGVV